MQITPDEGEPLTMLARLLKAKKRIEVGTFTGLSSLGFMFGMEDDGKLLSAVMFLLSSPILQRNTGRWQDSFIK